MIASKVRGSITYDGNFGHVCTCSEIVTGDNEPPAYSPTVFVVRDAESPTESGSYWYSCSRCGAGAWSGC